MKSKILLLSIFILPFMFSCNMKDMGNYDYINEETAIPVRIADFENIIGMRGNNLKIEPVFELFQNESRYKYEWYAISQNDNRRHDLSEQKNLDIEIKLAGGIYSLCYKVIDPEKDIFVLKRATLNVTESPVTFGWYLVKDDNVSITDLDYYDRVTGEKTENVLGRDGHELQGLGRSFWYNTSHWHQVKNEDGTTTLLMRQRAYHIATDRDIKTFNASNWELWKNFGDHFYANTEPSNVLFQNISGYLYVINNGEPYSLYNMMSNIGRVIPKLGTFNMVDGMIVTEEGMVMFDKNVNKFCNSGASGTAVSYPDFSNLAAAFHPVKEGRISCLNIYTGQIGGMTSNGYAVLQNTDTLSLHYLVRLNVTYGGLSRPLASIRSIPAESKLLKAKVVAVPPAALCLYFAEGNKLYVHKDNDLDLSQREVVLKEFPQGEEITYIGRIAQTSATYPPVFTHLVVATNKGGKYKIYRFNFDGANPEIIPTPVDESMTGDGYVRAAGYRAS